MSMKMCLDSHFCKIFVVLLKRIRYLCILRVCIRKTCRSISCPISSILHAFDVGLEKSISGGNTLTPSIMGYPDDNIQTYYVAIVPI